MMVYKIIVHIIGIILFKLLFHTNLTFCSIHNLPALSLFCQYEPSAYLDQYIPLIPFTIYSIIGFEFLLKTSTGFDGGCSTRFAVLALMSSSYCTAIYMSLEKVFDHPGRRWVVKNLFNEGEGARACPSARKLSEGM